MVFIAKGNESYKVYGITGHKEHGKDTFSRLLQGSKYGYKYKITHFADPLKDLCKLVFNLTDEQVNTTEGKKAKLINPIVIDNHLSFLRHYTKLDLKEQGKIANSVRELLQYVGSDYIRKEAGTFWIEKIRQCIESDKSIIISDVRFKNEANLIKSYGGKIIKIVRIDFPKEKDSHISELEIDEIKADLEIGVKTNDLSIVERITHLMALGKWDLALRYDYRKIKEMLVKYEEGSPTKECAAVLGIDSDDSEAFRIILKYYDISKRRLGSFTNPHKFINNIECKFCKICNIWKSLSSYNKCSSTYDMLHYICRECASKENKKEYSSSGKILTFTKLYNKCKYDANLRDIIFLLKEEDITAQYKKQKGVCFYTGETLSWTKGDNNKISIDRIDSTLGYEVGNIVLCCARVNIMKGNLPQEQFKKYISEIYIKWAGKNDSLKLK